MKIHKEGYKIILYSVIIYGLLAVLSWLAPWWFATVITAGMIFMIGFTFRFFRQPKRKRPDPDNMTIFAPADGEVVAIEEVYESEYFKDERIQVSIFMSIWNVHMNWFPVGGEIVYFRHHHGKFLVAWHPKSSSENERTTTVVDAGNHKVLFRQIAGFVARRIVNYAPKNDSAIQNANCGFIKFGSRVDLFLPLGSHINVKLGDLTVGTQTKVATLPPKSKCGASKSDNGDKQCN